MEIEHCLLLVGVSVPPAQGHWVGGCAGGWVSAAPAGIDLGCDWNLHAS